MKRTRIPKNARKVLEEATPDEIRQALEQLVYIKETAERAEKVILEYMRQNA